MIHLSISSTWKSPSRTGEETKIEVWSQGAWATLVVRAVVPLRAGADPLVNQCPRDFYFSCYPPFPIKGGGTGRVLGRLFISRGAIRWTESAEGITAGTHNRN